jgi:hypothetical protein
METQKLLSDLAHYNEIKQSYLISASRRFLYNLETMKSFEGFQSLFDLLKEVCNSELELNIHDRSYYYPMEYVYDRLQTLLCHETATDYLYSKCKEYKTELQGKENICREKIAEIENSISFRIGRAITFLPRKLRNGLSYAKEVGIRQMLKYIIVKIRNRSGSIF